MLEYTVCGPRSIMDQTNYVTWLIVSAICSLMETGFLYNNCSLVHYTEGESGIGFPLSSGGA